METHHRRAGKPLPTLAFALLAACSVSSAAAPVAAQGGGGWARHVVGGVALELPPSRPNPARVDSIGAVINHRRGHIHVDVLEVGAELDEVVRDMDRQGGTTTFVSELQLDRDRARFVYRVDGQYFIVLLRRVGDRVLRVLVDDLPGLESAARRVADSAERAGPRA